MARKTAEVDTLLTRIADELEAGRIPSLNDSVDLEMLYLDYLEYEGGKLAKELGLRDGNNIRNAQHFDGDKLNQNFINALVQKRIPKQSPSVIRAYINKQIAVSRLFGERYRKVRNNTPSQLRVFRGELVQKCLDRIEGLNCNHADNYGKNNVFTLLEDLTNAKLSKDDLLAKHPSVNDKQFEKIKVLINEEMDMLTDERSKLTSRNVFIEGYKLYKEVCDINNPRHRLKQR